MASKTTCLLPFIFLSLTTHFASVTSQTTTTFQASGCIRNGPVSSSLISDLNDLLPTLSSNIGDTGFQSDSLRSAYAAALCRADIPLSQCRGCVRNLEQEILQLRNCPLPQSQAVMNTQDCMVRYANGPILGRLATWSTANIQTSGSIASPDEFNTSRATLFDELRVAAANGGARQKAAAGNRSAGSQTVYALAQCTPDLSAQDCSDCLEVAVSNISQCCGGSPKAGVYKPNCNLRYDTQLFYDTTRVREPIQELSIPPSPSTPPSPPSPSSNSLSPPSSVSPTPGTTQGNRTRNSNSTRHSIIIVVPIVVFIIIAFCVAIFVRKRMKHKLKRDPESICQEPKEELESTKQEPKGKTESLKQQIKEEAASTKQGPKAEHEGTKQEPKREAESTKHKPKGHESTKQELKGEAESTKQEPKEEHESTKQEPEGEAESLKQQIKGEAASTKQEPKGEHESMKQEQKREAESTKQEPKEEQGSTKQEPEGEAESFKQLIKGEAAITKQEPEGEHKSTKQEPRKEHESTKQNAKGDSEIGEDVNKIRSFESIPYDFGEIKAATNHFSYMNKLGRGGFGAVYKGKLQNGEEIAVKRLSTNSCQGDLEFKNETLFLAKLQHKNLVSLLGFSMEEDERLLVYEFVQNRSLDRFIFDPIKSSNLNWETRYKIIVGVANGLSYLHYDSSVRIVHRDLKASNILLDEEMNPKISDFGLAKLVVRDTTQDHTSRIIGTLGYMAPEYVNGGNFSFKSDVFSFGVLVLEIVTGRKTGFQNEGNPGNLLSHAWRSWDSGKCASMIDPSLMVNSGAQQDMFRCFHIALLCVQRNPTDRPKMDEVVQMLTGSPPTLPPPKEPGFYIPSNFYQSQELNILSEKS